jgi:hypothetical protein
MPDNATIPPVTTAFITGLRGMLPEAQDSVARRFLEKLFSRSDKAASSFFTRLANALERNIPMERVLNGMEKKLLSEAYIEYADAEISRIDTQPQPLSVADEMALRSHARSQAPSEYQRDYNRRQWLGRGMQVGGVLLAPLLMEVEWYKDEDKRKTESKKGNERSPDYDRYCKIISQGKGVLKSAMVVVIGELVKPLGPSPKTVWHYRGKDLMEGLNQILVPLQAIQQDKNTGHPSP